MFILVFTISVIFTISLINKIVNHHEVTFLEFLINLLVPTLLFLIFWSVSIKIKLRDVEVLNGKVLDKKIEIVSCSHSYECNCITSCSGSGQNRSCSKICSTCYRHLFDKDYVVKTTIGNIYIDRVDSQGLKIPKRFDQVRIDEPVSKLSSYKNYIQASKNSIFNFKVVATKEEKKLFPRYPSKIYDYYKIDRVIDVSKFLSDKLIKELNLELSNILKNQISKKEHNVILVFHPFDDMFSLKLLNHWKGGKKNDILIFIEIEKDLKIKNVRVNSWALDTFFDVSLKDDILKLKDIKVDILDVIKINVENNYVRRSFKEFEYLKWQIIPSGLEISIYFVISLILTLYLSNRFKNN